MNLDSLAKNFMGRLGEKMSISIGKNYLIYVTLGKSHVDECDCWFVMKR